MEDVCSLTISDSNFTGNSAIFKSGGAIYAKSRISLTIDRSTMLENSAHSYGGALFTDRYSTVKLSNSCLCGNSIEYNGGAVFVSSSIFIAFNSQFIGNKALNGGFMRIWQRSEVYLEQCSVRENKAISEGGGVSVPGSRIRISHTEFSQNIAIRGRDIYMVSDGGKNASSAQSVKLYTYRSVFTMNGTRLLTTDEHFIEAAEQGNLIYGEDVNVFNEETPYASGRYKLCQ